MKKILSLLIVLVAGGCYYDKEAVLYPSSSNCTASDTPSYGLDITPILNAKCNSCHGGPYASAGVQLDNYNSVLLFVRNGKLLGSITHASGYSPMPKNMPALGDCELNNIRNWITNGSPNN